MHSISYLSTGALSTGLRTQTHTAGACNTTPTAKLGHLSQTKTLELTAGDEICPKGIGSSISRTVGRWEGHNDTHDRSVWKKHISYSNHFKDGKREYAVETLNIRWRLQSCTVPLSHRRLRDTISALLIICFVPSCEKNLWLIHSNMILALTAHVVTQNTAI